MSKLCLWYPEEESQPYHPMNSVAFGPQPFVHTTFLRPCLVLNMVLGTGDTENRGLTAPEAGGSSPVRGDYIVKICFLIGSIGLMDFP